MKKYEKIKNLKSSVDVNDESSIIRLSTLRLARVVTVLLYRVKCNQSCSIHMTTNHTMVNVH
jgi:hypothetical protein